MYKNTEHIVTFTAFGNDGEGICKIDSFTVFVPNAVKGDKAKILIIKEIILEHAQWLFLAEPGNTDLRGSPSTSAVVENGTDCLLSMIDRNNGNGITAW